MLGNPLGSDDKEVKQSMCRSDNKVNVDRRKARQGVRLAESREVQRTVKTNDQEGAVYPIWLLVYADC
jgi:hypothetical protein